VNDLRNRLMIGVGLGMLVLIGLALWSDLPSLRDALGQFDWRLFPLVLACTLFNYVLRFFKWHYYVRRLGVRNLAASRSARLFVAGFPLAFTPGKVGEALKAVWLSEWSGLTFASGLPIVVAERISDGLAVMALSTLGVFTYPQFWPGFLAIVVAVLGVIVVSQIRPLALAVLNVFSRLPIIGVRIAGLRAFYESSYQLFRPLPLIIAVGLGTLSWLGEGVGFYLILRGLGLEPSLQLLTLAVFVLAFSTVVGAVSALPGGVGAVEATLTGLLVMAIHLEHSLAGAATILIRLGTLWFGIALGLLVWASTPMLWKATSQPRVGNVAS
jgi:glycosyltransferase 2 family protein